MELTCTESPLPTYVRRGVEWTFVHYHSTCTIVHNRPGDRTSAEFVRADTDAFVLTGHLGEGPVATATWQRSWNGARNATGLRHLHFHDLRHAGNTLAAATGASTRELMARMGHASPRTALIYQHATSDRDQAIASALSNVSGHENLPSGGQTLPR
ncbi:MAG: tyrosine-type recombinase/integrase [Acidimicrobiales bacterium]